MTFSIDVTRRSRKAISSITINNNERVLRFNGEGTIRLEKVQIGRDLEEPNLFTYFNDYVERTFTSEQKTELFNLFEGAHNICENPVAKNYQVEAAAIKPYFNKIWDLVNTSKLASFIEYSNDYIKVPPDLVAASSKGDYPSQTTYTENDYRELVKTTFVVRVVYPILFSLLYRFDRDMGRGVSELECGRLIKDSPHLIHMPGWKKLNLYINYAFNKAGPRLPVDAVGSAEYLVERALFNTLFSRLCCAVIPETEEGKHLATAVNAAVRSADSGAENFRKKDDRDSGDDDKRSLLERYNVNEETKETNEVMTAEFFSQGLFDELDQERHVDRFKYVSEALNIQDVKLVEKVYDNFSPDWGFELHPHIVTVLQLTFADAVPPMIFWACDYTQLMAAIALGQVRLAEQGYSYLPAVLGAVHNPEGIRSLADGFKLNTSEKEYLSSICEIQSRNDEGLSFNQAIETATEFLDMFGNGQWHSNLEYGVLDDPKVYDRVQRGALFELEAELEVKTEFMRLVRQVNGEA